MYPALMAVLVASAAPTDLQNSDGHTGLHLACLLGDDDTVQVLLGAKANVFIVDFDNKAPISVAANRGYTR